MTPAQVEALSRLLRRAVVTVATDPDEVEFDPHWADLVMAKARIRSANAE